MTQEAFDNAIGKRIRALRGNETQASFAEKIGVSRAALANYETGRTRPNDMTVLKIANLTGVSPSSIVSDEVYSFDDLAALVGAKLKLDNIGDLSPAERAMVRLIRVSDDAIVKQVVTAILAGIKERSYRRDMVDVLNFESDVTQLAVIEADGGRYIRGFTRDTLAAIIAAMSANEAGEPKTDDE